MEQNFLEFLYNFLYNSRFIPLQILLLLSVFLIGFITYYYKNPQKESQDFRVRSALLDGWERTILSIRVLPFALLCVFVKKFASYLNLHKQLQEIVFFLLLVLVLSLIGFVVFIEKQDARSKQKMKKE